MAKVNGKLTTQTVGTWFSAIQFEEQQKVLSGLQHIHGKVRQVRIDALKRELAVLEKGSTNGHAAPKAAKRGPKKNTKGSVRVKYRDPKSGETWSGRGRMARWLADRVKAGEKQDKYLA
jgi:DNA-binding protein H-NS